MHGDDTLAPEHLRALADTTPDAFVTIDVDSTVRYANPAIEDLLGYPPADLIGEPLTVLMSDELARGHDRAIERYLETGTRSLDWDSVELPGTHRAGHEIPLEISFSEFTIDGERYFTGVLRDATERRRQTDRLERLNELGQALPETETVEEACEVAVAAARDVLDLTATSVERYDAGTGTLEPCARTAAVEDLVGDASLFAADRGLAWRAFVDGEAHVYADLEREADLDRSETALRSAIVLPLGPHGVFVSGATEPDAFSRTTVTLAEILAANAEATLDRLEREAALRERTASLESKNRQLRRLRRVNREIRGITRALLEADSAAEIKRLVCDQLAGSESYRFVWFGERDLAADEITATAAAGAESGYLDAVTVTVDESRTGLGPAGRALRTNEAQIQNDLRSDPPFEPWRRAAVERGYRASIAVPVTYRDTTYGLLNCYADEPGVFSEMEEAVLTELGEVIGYALNAMEQSDALVATDSVELEFAVRDGDALLVDALGDRDARFRLETVGGRSARDVIVFGRFDGLSADEVRALADRHGSVADLRVIREDGTGTLVEFSASGESFLVALLDRGAVLTGLRAAPDEARVTIRIARSASVREFVALFESRFENAELVARRESPDPVRSEAAFERSVLDRLTERQEHVLRTAYVAGYFEQPRESSARDVAETLDLSQPTVSRHVRAGEETLFSLLFGGDESA